MCEIAANSTRHIILDQTNVFPKARGRKVQEYRKFGQRRAVVILNDDDTLQERTEKREREEGKFVPLDAVMGMKQNFTKPHLDEGFTHIDYVEIPEHDAKHMIKKFNDQGWDYKRRNGGGNGQKNRPEKPLDQRDAKELKFDRKGFNEGGERKRVRSRSPLRHR
jgi:heterogeneous nuclear ribonucleoprotein U-like protein 1